MSESIITAQQAVAAHDLHHARQGVQALLDHLRVQDQTSPLNGVQRLVDDPYVISKVGDLQIRLEVAAALYERAADWVGSDEQRLIASSEAIIASADALQAVGNIEQELIGERSSLPVQGRREPLRWHYQIIGNHRLNGVTPPQLLE